MVEVRGQPAAAQAAPHPAGLDLPVRAAAVDTGGHHTKMAYEFCRTRLARRIWAVNRIPMLIRPTARSKSTSRGFARRLFANFPVCLPGI
ncbi:terminase gpA endonuclease subunit [Rhodovulum sulfidophilum]|uniref:terminase gpA endonuclease subunit n=1 Tax=Rhodovulum sulfidophilum TaxID=35806 RepID=UPI001F2A50F8|nr:terminase gpA endonuclease subunit [Rhodovulum sulfidophilum]